MCRPEAALAFAHRGARSRIRRHRGTLRRSCSDTPGRSGPRRSRAQAALKAPAEALRGAQRSRDGRAVSLAGGAVGAREGGGELLARWTGSASGAREPQEKGALRMTGAFGAGRRGQADEIRWGRCAKPEGRSGSASWSMVGEMRGGGRLLGRRSSGVGMRVEEEPDHPGDHGRERYARGGRAAVGVVEGRGGEFNDFSQLVGSRTRGRVARVGVSV